MTEKHNPFFDEDPLEGPRFFVDRDEEVRKLLEYVGNQMPCSVVGSRGIGKSSLIRQMIHLATSSDNSSADWRKCMWVYCNFHQMLSITQLDFWEGLLKSLAAAFTKLPEKCRGDIDLDIDIDGEHLFQSEELAAAEVETWLRRLASRDIRPIIVMDQFDDMVQSASLDYAFYGALRSLVPEVTYVTATERPLYSLGYPSGSVNTSPFFNVFVTLHVRLLSRAGAEELLLKLSSLGGAPFSPEDIGFLIDLAGCHPFFLQQAGYQLFQLYRKDGPRPERGDVHEAVENEVRLQARPHFEDLWCKLSQDQRPLLQRVAGAGGLDRGSLSASEKIALYELEDQALVSTVDGKSYKAFSQGFGEFVECRSE